MTKEWLVQNPSDLRNVALWALDEAVRTPFHVVGLYGDLGAGKTTFSQIMANELGIQENVSSPTFVIQKSYLFGDEKFGFNTLVHIDAYRLKSSRELEVLGWKELLAEEKTLIVIEWPEKVADIMPQHLELRFELDNSAENEHNRRVTAHI